MRVDGFFLAVWLLINHYQNDTGGYYWIIVHLV